MAVYVYVLDEIVMIFLAKVDVDERGLTFYIFRCSAQRRHVEPRGGRRDEQDGEQRERQQRGRCGRRDERRSPGPRRHRERPARYVFFVPLSVTTTTTTKFSLDSLSRRRLVGQHEEQGEQRRGCHVELEEAARRPAARHWRREQALQ